MRTFAQKQKSTQNTNSASPTAHSRGFCSKKYQEPSAPYFQRTIGNQAAQPLRQANAQELEVGSTTTAPIRLAYDFSQIPIYPNGRLKAQTKLMVNTPGDVYEQEADRVADHVMRAQDTLAGGRASALDISRLPAISPTMQSQAENEEEKAMLQAKSEDVSGAPQSADADTLVGRALQGSGQPMPETVRARMDRAFGADFSAVRLHTGGDATAAASAIQARAFTTGNNIVFGAGEKRLHTQVGQRLLAHELTHVVQQGGVRAPVQNRLRASSAPHPTIQRTPDSPDNTQSKDAPAASQQKKYELDAFALNKSNLTSDHKEKLKEYVEAIKKVLTANPQANIKIVGHTDTSGTPDTNTTIGQSRADTVKNALVDGGIAEDRIITVASMGEGQLKVETDDGVKEAKNRRVEIEIVGVKAPAPVKPETTEPAKQEKPDEPPKDAAKKDQGKKDVAKADEEKEAKEGKSKLKPSITIATLPYKIEVTPGKDPKKKFIVTGDFTLDYLLWKYKTGKFKLGIPASLQLAMLGIHDYKDHKWKFGSDLELGVGVNLKYSPFTSSALRDLYLKGSIDFSITGGLTTDFSKVTPGVNLGSDLKLGVGYTLGPVDLLLFGKGSFVYDIVDNKSKFSLTPMVGVKIPLGKKDDKK